MKRGNPLTQARFINYWQFWGFHILWHVSLHRRCRPFILRNVWTNKIHYYCNERI